MNVATFGVDSLSSHTDNRKNDFLVSDEGDTFGINRSFGALVKKFIGLILIKLLVLIKILILVILLEFALPW